MVTDQVCFLSPIPTLRKEMLNGEHARLKEEKNLALYFWHRQNLRITNILCLHIGSKTGSEGSNTANSYNKLKAFPTYVATSRIA